MRSTPCTMIRRTSKGSRLLVALTTDPQGDTAQAFLAEARGASPSLTDVPDDVLIDKLIALIANIPQECPGCGKSHG
jgi:hypothetical protein